MTIVVRRKEGMEAEELFVHCMTRSAGRAIAAKLAKLYVIIHFQHDYKKFIASENDALFVELASRFITYVESELTRTKGAHAAVLSALFLVDESDII